MNVDEIIEELTEEEVSVAQLWVEGRKREEIAIELGISASTVNLRFSTLRSKTEATNNGQLVYRLMSWGLIS